MGPERIQRRTLLQHTAAMAAGAFGLPYLVRSTALGNSRTAPANERITVGAIAMGGPGTV